jgi:Zn-finger nucleic acid-binding protein
VNCPSCSGPATQVTLQRHGGLPLELDLCGGCHAFWFDRHESLQLTPGSTLQLFTMIGDQPAAGRQPLAEVLRCPRCSKRLIPTQDRQRNTTFRYARCPEGHGRFITFFDFLREKNFIKPLTGEELKELRQSVKIVNCSNCGGPVDLAAGSSCAHCGSPLSMLDMKHAGALVEQLRKASEPRPVDPSLPLQMEQARRQVELSFAQFGGRKEWMIEASASGLVEAGLRFLASVVKGK